LKKINENLTFTTPQNYMQCINLRMMEEEQKFLENVVANEGEDCIIM